MKKNIQSITTRDLKTPEPPLIKFYLTEGPRKGKFEHVMQIEGVEIVSRPTPYIAN